MTGRAAARRLKGDQGSAIAEFALMTVLLVFLLFAVLQVAALFFVRSVVSSAASDGARLGSTVGSSPDEGARRASELISSGLSASMASHLPCSGSVTVDGPTGLAMARVRCAGTIRSVFVPIGALVHVDVTAGSLREQP